MGIKVNHYAAKTIVLNTQFNSEAFIIELFVGIVLTIMAIGGYKSGLLLLWLPCGIIAAACFFAVLYSTYRFMSDKITNKNKNG
jgi:hypothetical protein